MTGRAGRPGREEEEAFTAQAASAPPHHALGWVCVSASAGSQPLTVPLSSAGDAFSEEANRRFERYPGQTSNQIV